MVKPASNRKTVQEKVFNDKKTSIFSRVSKKNIDLTKTNISSKFLLGCCFYNEGAFNELSRPPKSFFGDVDALTYDNLIFIIIKLLSRLKTFYFDCFASNV